MKYLSKLLKRNTIHYDDTPFVFVDNHQKSPKKHDVDKKEQLEIQQKEQEKMLEKAESIIAKAEMKADEIIKQALADAAEIEKEGFVKGYNKGLIAAEKENEAELEHLKALICKLDDDTERFFEQAKQSVTELAMTIAEKVVSQKLSSDEAIFLKLYENAVKDLNAQKWIKLTVGKNEFEIATANSEYLIGLVSGAERIDVVVLDDAPAGTCIVETSEKIVDASILTQLQVLKNAIM